MFKEEAFRLMRTSSTLRQAANLRFKKASSLRSGFSRLFTISSGSIDYCEEWNEMYSLMSGKVIKRLMAG
uniref:AlNc14C195G8549 protein n=1 Tax=Albugo laibachii Nc14 TaxID=890382 RepID=F0WQ68_9STRA|nr:AlNc14C195G8549 [Albugo laibachii Nc14]CCA26689.1 AlNc14C403G11387 [Albugo laibachii Nc14]|eukprot:CCA26689.1 AlNc14C403G11387 [Albugo laibachii Nc14]